MKTAIGTILIVLGIGVLAAYVPDAIQAIVHDNYFGDGAALGFGAIMVAGGWFLRRSGSSGR